jgi:Zn-dependent protease
MREDRPTGDVNPDGVCVGTISRTPEEIIAILVAFIIATTIHECAHAVTALRLGDTTARDMGRVTLNPIAHFEPFGFFGMVLISLGYGFIGWGKPCPVNPSRFRYSFGGRRNLGMAIVALAGPISNVLQALIVAIPYQIAIRNDVIINPDVRLFLDWFIWVNILLASFNMIPIPPLDGYKILTGILPNFWGPILQPLERYGFMILFILVFVGGGIGSSIVGGMINPVQRSLTDLVFFMIR